MVLMSFPLLLPLWGGRGRCGAPSTAAQGALASRQDRGWSHPPPFSGGDSPLPGQVGSGCPAQGRARG